ncbi:Predicted nucleic acid-binding protein, contains Zn-ribbon domain [Lachnospiraceae bacterium XPB1003]|nr:Predicted nucleic acid-binding protein, contains Zn-ribbon domain [Lachnospiraceae bacterium XPB1003]
MSICVKCGTAIEENMNFCTNCGKTVAQDRPKKSKGKIPFLFLGMLLGVVITGIIFAAIVKLKNGNEKTIEGKGYDTPEEAVTAYANYLKESDIDGMISTFAVESFFDNYNAEKHLEYRNSLILMTGNEYSRWQPVICDSKQSRMVNLEGRRSYISNQIYLEYLQANLNNIDEDTFSGFDIALNTPLSLNDDFSIDDAMIFLENDPKLNTIEIGEVIENDDIWDDPTEIEEDYKKRYKKFLGAEDIESVCLEIEIDGKDYLLFMETVCYNGKWYNLRTNNLISMCLGVDSISGGLKSLDDLDIDI